MYLQGDANHRGGDRMDCEQRVIDFIILFFLSFNSRKVIRYSQEKSEKGHPTKYAHLHTNTNTALILNRRTETSILKQSQITFYFLNKACTQKILFFGHNFTFWHYQHCPIHETKRKPHFQSLSQMGKEFTSSHLFNPSHLHKKEKENQKH